MTVVISIEIRIATVAVAVASGIRRHRLLLVQLLFDGRPRESEEISHVLAQPFWITDGCGIQFEFEIRAGSE